MIMYINIINDLIYLSTSCISDNCYKIILMDYIITPEVTNKLIPINIFTFEKNHTIIRFNSANNTNNNIFKVLSNIGELSFVDKTKRKSKSLDCDNIININEMNKQNAVHNWNNIHPSLSINPTKDIDKAYELLLKLENILSEIKAYNK